MARNRKETRRKVQASRDKETKRIENAVSYLCDTPTWKFNRADFDHQTWNIEECDIKATQILRKLRDFEGMTWSQIQQASGGRRNGTNSHFIPFESMIKEAQKRADELNILEYEELFSLRLSAKERLFGILTDGIFSLIWYDENHKISISSKRNT